MIFKSLILIASVMIGALAANWFRSGNPLRLKIMLAFSGAYLLALAMMHLMPEIYAHSVEHHDTDHGHHHSHNPLPGLMVMLGFLFQVFLEMISHGVEHGHQHKPQKKTRSNIPFAAFISLCLHAFIESIPIGTQSHNPEITNKLFWAIAIHHIPVGIVLFSLLRDRKLSLKVTYSLLFLFAITAPLGMIFGGYLPNMNEINTYATAFVAGIFLHISTTILFEASEDHRFNLVKIGSVIVAILVAWGFSSI
jgi:zinc and cadmium transporter